MPRDQPSRSRSRARGRQAVALEVLETRLLLATGSSLVQIAAIDQTDSQSVAENLDNSSGSAVVSDDPATHSNPVTAEPVPYANSVLVEGAVAPTQAPDMYRVPLGSETSAVTVDLTSPASTAAAVRLWVFDASGQELGNFALAPSAELSVVLKPLDPSPGEPLFVAVSHDSTGSEAADSGLYILRITRLDDPSPILSPGGTTLLTTPFAAAMPSAAAPGASFGSTFLSHEESASVDIGAPIGMGQGPLSLPLPIRSAGPSAGLLGEGEAAPPLDLAADAVDRALFDLAAGDQLSRIRLEAGKIAVSRFEVIVVSREPAETVSRTAFYYQPKSIDLDRPHLEQRSDAVTPPATERRDSAGFDVSFSAGVGIAALMGVGLVLPDVATVVETYRRRCDRETTTGRRS